MMRIGHGYDVHKFGIETKNSFIVLGGVSIPYVKPLIAHSDGDVLVHAICDALLGAAALGDIGLHFPDSSDKYENIDSMELLKSVSEKLLAMGWTVSNVDSTIVTEQPKMANHIAEMCTQIAKTLKIDRSAVNVKATTTEGLGFSGRSEGIEAHAVILLHD